MGCLFLSFVETLEEIWFCRFFHVLHVQVCENMAHLLVPAVRFFELSRALEKKKKKKKKERSTKIAIFFRPTEYEIRGLDSMSEF